MAEVRLLLAAVTMALASVTLTSSPATAASKSAVRIDLQISGQIDTCVGVTGPAACMYEHYSVSGTADPTITSCASTGPTICSFETLGA